MKPIIVEFPVELFTEETPENVWNDSVKERTYFDGVISINLCNINYYFPYSSDEKDDLRDPKNAPTTMVRFGKLGDSEVIINMSYENFHKKVMEAISSYEYA